MTSTESLIREELLRATGEEAARVEQMAGGANSLAYKITTEKGAAYLAKKYRVRGEDSHDRLQTEFSGLSFLWSCGVRAIPEPVCRSSGQRIGIYRFIEGRKLAAGAVSREDVSQAAAFLRTLHSLSRAEGAQRQPTAKEACFSMNAYLEVVRQRLDKLGSLPETPSSLYGLGTYLRSHLRPFFEEVSEFVSGECGRLHIAADEDIPPGKRILSPSDFGFHNAIKRPDGSVVFIDFEYYGWDDPAKTIADFYLQPEVPVPERFREEFFGLTCGFLEDREDLAMRLPMVYAVLSLKWCLIMLNIFLRPQEGRGKSRIFDEQLKKSKKSLARAREDLENKAFPLSLN